MHYINIHGTNRLYFSDFKPSYIMDTLRFKILYHAMHMLLRRQPQTKMPW